MKVIAGLKLAKKFNFDLNSNNPFSGLSEGDKESHFFPPTAPRSIESAFLALSKTFEDIEGYNDIVLLKNINFESHCEHHMVPIIGRASIGYYPDKRVVGISKLARVLDLYAKRLQTQETMTAQILNCIDKTLLPKGTAVFIDAEHHCMSTRGVLKNDVTMTTNLFSGCFLEDTNLQDRFLKMAT